MVFNFLLLYYRVGMTLKAYPWCTKTTLHTKMECCRLLTKWEQPTCPGNTKSPMLLETVLRASRGRLMMNSLTMTLFSQIPWKARVYILRTIVWKLNRSNLSPIWLVETLYQTFIPPSSIFLILNLTMMWTIVYQMKWKPWKWTSTNTLFQNKNSDTQLFLVLVHLTWETNRLWWQCPA